MHRMILLLAVVGILGLGAGVSAYTLQDRGVAEVTCDLTACTPEDCVPCDPCPVPCPVTDR